MVIIFITLIFFIILIAKAVKYQNSNNTADILGISYDNHHLKSDKSSAQRLLEQLAESLDMVDKTLNPETFFKRLHFSFDCILELMTYNPSLFKDATPEEEYARLFSGIENRVNALIERTYTHEKISAATLKTEKAKQNRYIKYFAKMEVTFKHANELWNGNEGSPHYDGPLYTANNLKKLEEMKKMFT